MLNSNNEQIKCKACNKIPNKQKYSIVKSSNIIFSCKLGICEIKGFNVGDVICWYCLNHCDEIGNLSLNPCDYIECDLCNQKYERSMNFHSWEGWGCASAYCVKRKAIHCGFGSKFDMNVIKFDKVKFCESWKNVDLNRKFIICDECITHGLKTKIFEMEKKYMI